MKLFLRLAAAAVTAALLSGGSCTAGREGFAETPAVAEASQPEPSSSPAPGPAPSQPVTFTSFLAVQPNQTVVAATVSSVATFTAQQENGDWRLTSFLAQSSSHAAGAQLTYDAAEALSGIRLESPAETLDFQRSAGHEVSCSGLGSCRGKNSSQNVVLIDPARTGWNYQTFGVWGGESLSASGRLGAVSIGAPTPGITLPRGGTYNFTGMAVGIYSDPAGALNATGATLSATVNFATRSIAFGTTGTFIGALNGTGARTDAPGLNLSGNLSFAANQNVVSGPVQTQNGALTGNADGRFYGPAATEFGGVYSLSGSGNSRMIGGFGGRR
jgi:hypothetical protein